MFPFAPSLDTVGIFTRSVKDCAYVLNATAGRDEKDITSSVKPVCDYAKDIDKFDKKRKIAVIQEILDAVKDKDLKKAFIDNVEKLKQSGFAVEYVHMPVDMLSSLFATYFVISCAEATSNNANLDGIKFGPLSKGDTYEEVMKNARTKGFGELIKRRFIIGSFALMKENQAELFVRAQRNRRAVVDKLNEIYKDYDFIYALAAPSIAPKIGESSDRLSDEYLIADNHLGLGNFAGLPSLTLPLGLKNDMPFGVNVMGKAFDEVGVFQLSYEIEKITGLKDLLAKGEQE